MSADASKRRPASKRPEQSGRYRAAWRPRFGSGATARRLPFPQTAPYAGALLRSIETAGPAFAIQPIAMPIRHAGTIENAIEAFAREMNPGLLVLPDVTTTLHEELIVKLAAQHRLPAIYPWRHFVTAGGLMCYAVDLPDLWRRSASYVDRMLKGEKPTDLPVQVPTKYQLVLNLKIAKAIGLEVPPTLLARADEVIE